MENNNIVRQNSNFNVVFKQSLTRSLKSFGLYLAYGLFIAIVTLILMLTSLLPGFKSGGKTTQEILKTIFFPLVWTGGIMIGTCATVIATTVVDLGEMTFVLSRPISRNTYLLSKTSCTFLLSLPLYLYYIVIFLITQYILHDRSGYYVFQGGVDGINYSTLFIPPLLIISFVVYMVFLLRPYIKRDGIINVVFIGVVFLTYQLPNILYQVLGTKVNGESANMNVCCNIIPDLVFGIGTLTMLICTFLLYKKIYIKV